MALSGFQSLLQSWNPSQVTILSDSLWTGIEASRMASQAPIALAPLSCSLRTVRHHLG